MATSDSGSNFKQQRKVEAAACENTIRQLLADHYGVDPGAVVSVESDTQTRYDTSGTVEPAHLLDFAGIDWIVGDPPEIIPVGQRVRPTGDHMDFSVRVHNEAAPACEIDYLRQSFRPESILFARADGADMAGAWLLDTESVITTIRNGDPEVHDSGDGTAAAYLPVDKLRTRGCVVDEWDDPDPVTQKQSGTTSNMTDEPEGADELTDEERAKIEADPVLEISDVVDE